MLVRFIRQTILISHFINWKIFVISLIIFFTGGCGGKVFQDQLDDGKTLKLSRKQLRKAFTILGSQLSEVEEKGSRE